MSMYKLNLQEIKARMRKVRQDLGVSYEDLSELTGLSVKTLRRHGDPSDPTMPSLMAVAQFCYRYNVSIDFLVVGPERMSPEDDDRWEMALSWWTANLSAEKKRLLLAIMYDVWDKAKE